MKTRLRVISLLSAFLALGINSAIGQTTEDDFYRQWVDYRDGEISLDFDRIPLLFALHAIQAKTGFQIVIPSSSEAQVLNLRVRRQPLEPAMRALFSGIGYQNFALLYDDRGRPSRAVVLNVKPAQSNVEDAKKETSKQLSTQDQEKVQKELARWRELKEEERSRIEERLKDMPPSEQREKLVSEYGRQVLGLSN